MMEEIALFRAENARSVARLCAAEGWDFWDDPDAVARALTAPGVTTFVALEASDLVGAIEVIGDGEINWIVGMLIVAPHRRGQGIGTALLRHAFRDIGPRRLDLLTEADGPRFYRRLPGREMTGFRLYPPAELSASRSRGQR